MENSAIETLYRPKRYASIDFLRGMAILTMLLLHTVMDTFEVDKYVNELNKPTLVSPKKNNNGKLFKIVSLYLIISL